jgi:2-polyprenyl-3-methyl-5-hydroxy-6-metoxy-1,4-benzoquinol methylase
LERQESTTLDGIHAGHLERYKFASGRVSGRVLDAACGVGYGSKLLFDSGCVVTGVDIEPKAIDRANEFYNGPTFIVGDVLDKPWSGRFDWCVSFETIEHLPKPVEVLKAFRESCDRLLVSTPNEEKYKFNKWQYANDKYPHLRHFTNKELEEILTQSGWVVEERFSQENKRSPVTSGTDGMFIIYDCR